ncbi:MAG: class I SAM-dependent methyltransferase [Nitrospirae bacterium]|nr:class I SAM-dependent methyltransferase [Nitrospirota bacterium]
MSDRKQQQTSECFAYKWAKRETYESEAVKQKIYKWLVERYFGSEDARAVFLAGNKGKKILDAGCGSGFSASLLFGRHLNEMEYTGVDISDSVDTARARFREQGIRGDFIKDSIADMRLGDRFDVIISEGVLHHTSVPFDSFRNLVSHLNNKGVIMFYVYRKKAPAREFADDFIRERLKSLSDEEAWEKLLPLTKLGKIIGDLNIEMEIDEDIDMLEIPKGRYNIQRFFYWFFLKMYYDEKFSLEEMNHINFDWYRPLNCHRHTPEEVRQWCAEAGVVIERMDVQEAGITVVASKK